MATTAGELPTCSSRIIKARRSAGALAERTAGHSHGEDIEYRSMALELTLGRAVVDLSSVGSPI